MRVELLYSDFYTCLNAYFAASTRGMEQATLPLFEQQQPIRHAIVSAVLLPKNIVSAVVNLRNLDRPSNALQGSLSLEL